MNINKKNPLAAVSLMPAHLSAEGLSKSFNTTGNIPFVDSKACRQASSGACRIHYPLTVVAGETYVAANAASVRGDQHNHNYQDFYLLTQKGYKEGPNQDRSFVLSPIMLEQSMGGDDPSSTSTGMLMVGLFDGHSEDGHLTAEAALDEIPRRLLANLEREQERSQSQYPSPEVVQEVLETTFLQVDSGSSIQKIKFGGSTAIVALQMGPTVYLASAGDSTAFVARYRTSPNSSKGEVVILSTARRHKPADPDERARVIAHGGTVYIPPDPTQTSRVIMGNYGLAMSRCFGDLLGKPSGVLTAQPTVRTLNLLDYHVEGESEYDDSAAKDNDQFFVVVASDGVVDYMPIQHVAEQVAASLYETNTSGSPSPSLAQTCHSLIQESSALWHAALEGHYRDDMTLVVSKLSL
jgi:serine/threonine protein phosphatase PrpC